jgi:CBS domain-containing protein
LPDALTAATVSANAPISGAVRRLARPELPPLCVVDDDQRLVGVLTGRDLIALYRRPDGYIAADVRVVIDADRIRPTRDPACPAVEVLAGALTLSTYRSQVEHAGLASSRVGRVIMVHNMVTYNVDDMLVTGF